MIGKIVYFSSSLNKSVILINKKKVSRISMTEYPVSKSLYKIAIDALRFFSFLQ